MTPRELCNTVVLGLQPEVLSRGTRRLLWAAVLLLGVQIALGGWVSTNYAVLACNTFPTCRGSWWPSMDFAGGFTLWRPLGRNADGSLLDFHALTAIRYVHRLAAYAVIAVLLLLVTRLVRARRLAR